MNNHLVSILIGSIRPRLLNICLESIRRHTSDIDYEVVIVSPFEIEANPKMVHIKEKPGGYYKAIADGFEATRGNYIIHIADDCRATPKWAANMIAFMKPHDNEIFEGSFRHFDVRGERPEQGHYGKLIAPFICIRKDNALRVGGLIDSSYQRFFGDPDLSLRVWQQHGKVETCPNAWIYHCDFDDDQYVKAYNKYFTKDRETFISRWYHVFGRQGDTPLGHEQPLGKLHPDEVLPPEQCTKVYISLRKKDWETVRNIIGSEEGEVYPEGLPWLYELVKAMVRTYYYQKKLLYAVLEWMGGKGSEPAISTLAAEKKLTFFQKFKRYLSTFITALVTIRMVKLALRIFPDTFKQQLQKRWGLIQAITLVNSKS